MNRMPSLRSYWEADYFQVNWVLLLVGISTGLAALALGAPTSAFVVIQLGMMLFPVAHGIANASPRRQTRRVVVAVLVALWLIAAIKVALVGAFKFGGFGALSGLLAPASPLYGLFVLSPGTPTSRLPNARMRSGIHDEREPTK